MAARYVTIGQFPDVRIELRGRLSEILAESGANPGTYACPEDVVGCFLEMGADGKWAGASVGTFSSFAELDALPKGGLAVGAQATANGVPYTYQGGGAGWRNAFSPNYVGSSIPPLGSYVGEFIQVDNPAVPGGRSILRWTETLWAPPAGELIAAAVSSTPSPVALVTPGALTLTQIWASPVIPDYMIPNLLQMEIVGNYGVSNGSGVSGAILGIGLCGAVPVKGGADDYPLGLSLTPSVIFVGITSGTHGRRHVSRRGSAFYHQNGGSGQASGIEYASTGPRNPGSNKLYAMAKASHVNDSFRLEHIEVYSRGNL